MSARVRFDYKQSIHRETKLLHYAQARLSHFIMKDNSHLATQMLQLLRRRTQAENDMIIGQYTPKSGLGNKMTQFASLISLAMDIDRPIEIPGIEGFPQTKKVTPLLTTAGRVSVGQPCAIPSRHYINRGWYRDLAGRTIITRPGNYLENTYNFHHHRDALLPIFRLPSLPLSQYIFYRGPLGSLKRTYVDTIRSDDLMISLRLGDFVNKVDADDMWQKCVYSRYLGYSYFQLILNQITFGRLFITSDEPFHSLTKKFDRFDPIRVQNDAPLNTMALVSRFRRIAISESTFSWWASYLSDAEEIYFPISINGLWGINETWNKSTASWYPLNPFNVKDSDLYLRVDEDRYKYVHQASGLIYRYRDAPGKRTLDEFEHLPPEREEVV